jgi:predicted membrane chloride channel (bestrophin family)
MIKDPDFYTITMARVYEDQGHWEKAAEIYRYLLKQEPERKDIADALAEAEKRLVEGITKNADDLTPLIGEWIHLMFRYKRLQKLRQLKNQLQRSVIPE